MHRNNNGKYEVSLKNIMVFVSLILIVAGMGGAWGGQRIAVSSLRERVVENKAQLGVVQAEQVVLKVEVMRLSTTIDNLNRILIRLENRLDAVGGE